MSAEVDDCIAESRHWSAEMAALRPTLVGCGLTEQLKWRKPCYSHDDKNIVIMQEMKAFLALMFFKGALLNDPAGVLEEQGPNSRSAQRICFRSVDDVTRLAAVVEAYVHEAVEVEEAGLELGPAPERAFADELQDRLDADSAFSAAFEALTPGRQREYNLHISAAKKVSTREARVDKYVDRILDGKGMRDR